MAVWERRWHPLRGEWVLFTSHRAARPWIGDAAAVTSTPASSYDPSCTLCPGNVRVSGVRNEEYRGAWWFTNDLPTFGGDAPPPADDPLYRVGAAAGTAEVVCHHPAHDCSLGRLDPAELRAVVELWRARSVDLARRDDVDHVLIFENRGSLVGTSNPHPHSQIYAGSMVYGFAEREWRIGEDHLAATGRTLAAEIVRREETGGRLIASNDTFVAFVPWFACYAYEVMVLPRRPADSLAALTREERSDLAALVGTVVRGYDGLWDQEMPYVMAIHQAPCDGRPSAGYPFHLEFHPPLRTPVLQKFLAGPEIGGGTMTNESDPDEKAEELRSAVRRSKGE